MLVMASTKRRTNAPIRFPPHCFPHGTLHSFITLRSMYEQTENCNPTREVNPSTGIHEGSRRTSVPKGRATCSPGGQGDTRRRGPEMVQYLCEDMPTVLHRRGAVIM